jgi:methylase of polypeptide subunit release factors
MPPSPLTHLLVRSLRVPAGGVVVDAGCGSGLLSVAAADHGARLVYALDTNPRALAETVSLARRAGCSRRVVPVLADLSDLASILPLGVDTILCNPPQLPTPSGAGRRAARSAYDAGADGRRYIRAVVGVVTALRAANLERKPTLQLVTSSVADPESTIADLRAEGFDVTVVAETTAAFRPAYYDVVENLREGSYFRMGDELHERIFSLFAIPSGGEP